MKSTITTETQTFENYLAANLSKQDFDSLTIKLNVSANKLTRLLKEPSEITHESLVIIMQLLPKNITALDLINKFDVGIDAICIRDFRLLQ